FRIEFFGDEVDSIRTFDVETQLSREQKKKITIIPNIENKKITEQRESFFEYIAKKSVIWLKNEAVFFSAIDQLFQKATTAYEALDPVIKRLKPEELFSTKNVLEDQLSDFVSVK